ncbi:Antitoxin [Candidatus Magnetomoraceae bacterium gMMP-15]
MINTVSTTNARKNFAKIVNKAAYGTEPIILTHRGQKIAALISMKELELLRQIEDYIDIEDAKQALAEPGANIPAQEVWQELGL